MASSVATLLVLAIGAGWVLRTVNDERDLARAADRRAQIVETVSRLVPTPDPTSFIYAFGEPHLVGAWPVFPTSWDLRAALRLRYEDPSLDGRTVRSNVVWVCGYQRMAPVRVRRTLGKLKLSHYTYAVPYRSAVFVDVPGKRAQHIDSRGECRVASQRFVERQLGRLHDLSPPRTALIRLLLGPRGERLVEAYFHNPRTGRDKIARLWRTAHGTGGDDRKAR